MNTAKRVPVLAVAGWVIYDLANTLFSFNVGVLYLPLWVVNDMGGQDSDYALASSLSMALIFLTAPFLGALSDQARGRKPFLIVTTLICVAFTALLGQGGLMATLVFFVIANFFYQAGVIFYDSLLPAVSTPATRGRVGGIGVSAGALGAVMGVALGGLILSRNERAEAIVFQVTAVLFLLFALPCFLFVRETPNPNACPFGMGAVRAAVGELAQTTSRIHRYPGLGRFLLGRVFYTDAANTLTAFVGIYVTNEVGFSEAAARILLIVIVGSSVIGGFLWGILVDRIGPKRTLNLVLAVWVIDFILVAAVGAFKLPAQLFWVLGPIGGLCLSGTWAADRPLMLRISPPRYLGQFYGLYSMVGRFAAIIGPLAWAAIVDGLGFGRPVAVLSLAVMTLISLFILRPVSDEPRVWTDEDLVSPAPADETPEAGKAAAAS